LDEERFEELRRKEQALMMQRHVGPTRRKLTSTQASQKKKKPKTVHDTLPLLPNGLFVKTVYKLNSLQRWQEDARIARATVEEWMERYRLNRYSYWQERQQEQICGEVRECLKCSNGYSCGATGDELMQCLDCSFIGCGPQSLLEESNQHMMHHMIRTGHSFAVTCGERADVFCFKCGDIIYHEIFDQERERIDISKRLPWMGWHDGPVQRSFDAMQFLNTTENGVIWRGMIASYPQLVPQELVRASRLSMQRLLVNRGELSSPSSLAWGSQALGFAVYQNENESSRLSAIQAPVGMYNLGNTCFMTCILQCLIHCVPLQQHFLQHVGHHHKSCELVRSAYTKNDAKSSDKSTSAKSANDEFDKANICLACEMDKLFLQYFGSSIGQDVARAVCQAPHPLSRYETPTQGSNFKAKSGGLDGADTTCRQGEPLVTTKLLAAAWKSGGMDHLAGYEQGDAHEFLQAFLDIVGKHEGEYRKVLRFMQRLALPSFVPAETSAVTSQDADIIKRLFEGTLRSVLICDECGCKRKMPETFLNVSLPLSKHFHEKNVAGTRGSSKAKMSLERCLEHFTAPESLADPVDCPQCMKKTRTKKQHTFAKVPKVFCLHLKRFDAAKNRKIDDFVSFPARGLDMGRFYPHWSEIGIGESNTVNDNDTSPQVLYDLFATANHTGTLHQGHYVANVKVGSDWYHCNDQMVSRYDEKDVLHSEGAYVLFYIRR
jgi:ubiquitin C-terminal hydrolase